MNSRHARVLVLAAFATALSVLTACNPGDSGEDTGPQPAVTVTVTTATQTAVPVPTVTVSPLGENEARDRYLTALGTVDADLVKDADKAVERGNTVCGAADKNPTDQDGLIETVQQAFADADNPSGIDNAKALRILDVVRTNLCPDN